jgi:hypothetical protein
VYRKVIGGGTRVTVPRATPATRTGGLLALPTNISAHRRDEFARVPELGVRLGYQLNEQLRASVGYTWLY